MLNKHVDLEEIYRVKDLCLVLFRMGKVKIMICWFSKGKREKQFLTSLIGLVILYFFAFSPLTVDAQIFPYFPYNLRPGLGGYNFVPGIPTYPFFNPFNTFSNTLVPNAGLRNIYASSLNLSAPAAPSPIASLAGVTTVFIPPSATDLRVVVKVPGVTSIKLSSLVAPLTVYIYPTGYVPPTTAPIIVPPAIAPVASTILPTTTTIAPAVVSGGLWRLPLFNPIF